MAAADAAMWIALMTRADEVMAVTANLDTAFLGAARQEPVTCDARVLRFGRRLVYGTAECRGADGRLLTHHTITYARPA
jgi:acyl-coenzyme A thioesterase PaaI-like protein